MIRLTNLSKKYGSFTAVDAINLTVPPGELFGFLGPNGAGKTTTLRMIAGILQPTSGSVEIGGIDIAKDINAAERDKPDAKRWKDIWSAGHSVSGVSDIPSVAELVERTAAEYESSRAIAARSPPPSPAAPISAAPRAAARPRPSNRRC